MDLRELWGSIPQTIVSCFLTGSPLDTHWMHCGDDPSRSHLYSYFLTTQACLQSCGAIQITGIMLASAGHAWQADGQRGPLVSSKHGHCFSTEDAFLDARCWVYFTFFMGVISIGMMELLAAVFVEALLSEKVISFNYLHLDVNVVACRHPMFDSLEL